jgi:hypothetical protein
VATTSDFMGFGNNDHSLLANRDTPDQRNITRLVTQQTRQNPNPQLVRTNSDSQEVA